ncbi:MAG: hypothetical protein IJM15_08240 [Erysipelotrichaceae bacterium]|nr:hypothetical protein [Erysipelotrichaceae bacterium]
MKEFTVPMALVDYIPVVLFSLATVILIKNLVRKEKPIAEAMIVIGGFLIAAAGFLKATYKLLYALNVGDFVWMSDQMMVNQALGMLISGIGLTLFTVKDSGRARAYLVIPTMAKIGCMIVGLCAMDASLSFMAAKLNRKKAMPLFIISFFCSLCMGYLSSRDFTKASMNWIAQGVNTMGQLLYYLGCRALDKGGLKNLKF